MNINFPQANLVVDLLKEAGATRVLLVGGFVRDQVWNELHSEGPKIEPKDLDIEVYGVTYDQVLQALKSLSPAVIGASFSTCYLPGLNIEVSLPRTEQKIGVGHKGFEIVPGPNLSPKEAAERRDFTINSMMIDTDTGKLLDPYLGKRDLRLGNLTATSSSSFSDDALRVLRGMQFCSRFKLIPDANTCHWAYKALVEYHIISKERIWAELVKWTKGNYPRHGLAFLEETRWLETNLFKLFVPLKRCTQGKLQHPEGPVWRHTCLVVDAAAYYANEADLNEKDRVVLLLAALLHDIGKPATRKEDEEGNISFLNHENVGAELASGFLTSVGAPFKIHDRVVNLVKYHMRLHKGCPITEAGVRRLVKDLKPDNDIYIWQLLRMADGGGRGLGYRPFSAKLQAVTLYEEMQSRGEQFKPLLMGKHLIELGYLPGPSMGVILKAAEQAQIEGMFSDLVGAKSWVSENVMSPVTSSSKEF